MNHQDNYRTDSNRDENKGYMEVSGGSKAPELVLEQLFLNGEISQLLKKLKVRWPGMPGDEVELALSEALCVLLIKLRKNIEIENPQAFIWRISVHKISDSYKRMKREVYMPDEKLLMLAGRSDCLSEESQEYETGRKKKNLKTAIDLARKNINKSGNKNIQKVLLHILKSIEQGQEDISNKDIAAALGLRAATVRVYRFRAFKNLEKHFNEIGRNY